jgi:hypothetical protein
VGRAGTVTHRIPEPGGYSFDPEDGYFWFRCPNCLATGSLDEHEVTMYPDKTIDVEPSIVCECGQHFRVVRSVFVPA